MVRQSDVDAGAGGSGDKVAELKGDTCVFLQIDIMHCLIDCIYQLVLLKLQPERLGECITNRLREP